MQRSSYRKFCVNWPGGSCQMPWLSLIGTSLPAVQVPKPRLRSSETPGEVAFSSSEGKSQADCGSAPMKNDMPSTNTSHILSEFLPRRPLSTVNAAAGHAGGTESGVCPREVRSGRRRRDAGWTGSQ